MCFVPASLYAGTIRSIARLLALSDDQDIEGMFRGSVGFAGGSRV